MTHPNFFWWLLEFNLSLIAGFTAYWFLFRKRSYYQWNRFFLVIWPIICLIIASLHLPYTIEVQLPISSEFEGENTAIFEAPKSAHINASGHPENTFTSFWRNLHIGKTIWWNIYLLGLLTTLGLFAFRLKRLWQLIKMGWPKNEKGYTVLEHPSYTQIFSFGYYIFKNKDEKIPEMVLAHELVHIHQKHSLDLLWMELLLIMNWFNPLVYLHRKYLKETHEFIADQAVVQQYGLMDYARLLIAQATQQPVPVLALSFAAFTKKRIIAMKTKTTNAWSRVHFLILIPIVLILVSAFAIKPIEKIEYLAKVPLENDSSFAWEDALSLNEYNKSNPPENLAFANDLTDLSGAMFFNQKSNFILPIEKDKINKVSSKYGMRVHPILKKKQLHRGIDIVAPLGTPILAVENGEVIEADEKAYGYGKKVVIRHANGLLTLYAQMQSISVKVGDQLNQGQQLGELGSSGLSTNPHLHFEVRKNKVAQDPMKFLPEIDIKK